MSVVTMKSLLESGVHFGHQTKRWNPKMARFIFSERNGIHIIDLQKTSACIIEAYDAVRSVVKQGKTDLFVGKKKQAQQAIETEANAAACRGVNHRWLGGMLTNFSTIKIHRHTQKIERMENDGTFNALTKKEISLLEKQKEKLEKNLGGIKDMKELPGAIFVIDTKKEAIAIAEATRLGIPVIAVVDTNCDPTYITYPIPGNDDAIRAISLFVEIIANAVIDARQRSGNPNHRKPGDDDEPIEEPEVSKKDDDDDDEAIVYSTDDDADYSKFEDEEEEEDDRTDEDDDEDETLYND